MFALVLAMEARPKRTFGWMSFNGFVGDGVAVVVAVLAMTVGGMVVGVSTGWAWMVLLREVFSGVSREGVLVLGGRLMSSRLVAMMLKEKLRQLRIVVLAIR